MAISIPDLWPGDLTVDVLSPLAILRAQASLLEQKTKGLLRAEVTTNVVEKKDVQHQFDIVAPALNKYRYRVLVASHKPDLVYPVVIRWSPDAYEIEYSESELLHALGNILSSVSVRSVIDSLIAKSNEAKDGGESNNDDL